MSWLVRGIRWALIAYVVSFVAINLAMRVAPSEQAVSCIVRGFEPSPTIDEEETSKGAKAEARHQSRDDKCGTVDGPLAPVQAFADRMLLWQEPGTELEDLALIKGRPYASPDRYLIALFTGDKGVLEVYKVIGKEEDKIRLIGRKVFQSFPFIELDRIENINRDGYEEIAIEGWNGGNCWMCSGLAIFQVRDDQLVQISPNIPYSAYEDSFFRGSIDDIDGDGRKELLVKYNRFEFAFNFSHGASPIAWSIYDWKDCYYREASSEYGFYYDQQLKRLKRSAEEAYGDNHLEGYVSDLISILIIRVLKGEGKEGWSEFADLVDTPESHQRWKEYRVGFPVFPSLDEIISTVRRVIFEY